jgi:hypothetical protein
MRTYRFFAMLMLIFFVVVGCTGNQGKKPVLGTEPQNSQQNSSDELIYNVSSLIDYNNSLCSGTGYHYKPNGYNSGIMLVLKDKRTGKILQGSGWAETSDGGGSLNPEYYSCDEGMDSGDVAIAAFATGYAPSVVAFEYPKNKLATVEVFMEKSCSRPSFGDNKTSSIIVSNGNRAELSDEIYSAVEEQFGLNRTDYKLTCIEANLGRGGYVKATGMYEGESYFELYYRFGWCSSGGADCGWSKCFSSANSTLFESVKTGICDEISSRQLYDEYMCNTSGAYDNTTVAKDLCINGGLEKADAGKKSISVVQGSNRCGDSVSAGNFNCLEN